MEPTTRGLDENVASTLAYAFGWITGALFLLLEPSNRVVRFHAWQSVIVFGALSIAWFIAVSIPLFGTIVAFIIIPPVSAFLWLFLMYKAYNGQRYKVPYAGDMAEHRL